ncbi:MAG: MFS transporter [Thermoanaerobaculia bacterium]|nr:MFS transporter [Thermoanaerobaculia bacterium]
MIFRFSLYGFLKNQRYFEPFLVLVLLEKGFSFFLVGMLIAFRELTVNLLEIPSGAVADAWGRRGSMILSFSVYIVSFLLFGLAESQLGMFAAMFFYAVGDAFRTGTHKAMIFEWLRLQGREDEKARVYGYTRSWSKIGSAVSVVLAAVLVVVSGNFSSVFYFATVPYVLSIVNMLGYPAELDGEHEKVRSPSAVVRHLRDSLSVTIRQRPLRRLVAESMGWEGVFHAVKDYLQPVLQAIVLASWAVPLATDAESEARRTALLVGPVFFGLFLLAAVASRSAHRVVRAAGSEERAATWLWGVNALVCLALSWAAYLQILPGVAVAFVVIYVLQNVWRPILISRFDQHSAASRGATVLSIESQAHRAATMVVAPILGWSVDLVQRHGLGGDFWPVGAVSAGAALLFFFSALRHRNSRDPRSE